MFSEDLQPIAAFATTPQGVARLQPLWETGAIILWVPEPISLPSPHIRTYGGSLRSQVETLWPQQRSFVFCLAMGAVVRLVAPLLQHKFTDPAIVVVDEQGQFVVSLCSGHQGGADRLTQSIAALLGATPVLTGASHSLHLPGIDVLGVPFGWNRGCGDWTAVSAAIARREPVQVIQEAGSNLWQSHLPTEHSFHFGFPEHTATQKPEPVAFKGRVWISPIQRTFAEETDLPKVQWHPRVLWVGVGCERNTPRSVIEAAIQQACRTSHLSELAIAGIATLDRKGDEPGLLELCQDRSWPLKCFSPEALSAIPVPNPSAVVAAEVGTPSVAEAAALLACQPTPNPQLRVPKQIFRQEGQPGAVTVAIVESSQEYTGRTGNLYLVGIGPGQLDQITPAAKQAIGQADVVIGYSLYVDLVRSLLRPGQIVEALPITQERQRASRAIELAQWGLSVAVISSGD
ncbi:MAG: cobalamin biosynthesis protein, partial [Leptolyngbyaceae cyanobacterium bins.59]|nr:cobalamin biosynthesis protein [Leptolyngbyaceae cyanobacterium bins.59]